MKKPKIIIIRNAYSYDFGGGERFPVFLAHELRDDFEPVVVSSSRKLLAFAELQKIVTLKGPWWSKQRWSGKNTLLLPIYLAWLLYVFLWYLVLFIRLKPSVVHPQSKDDFIAATLAGKIVGARIIWTDHADLKHVWLNVQRPFKNPVGKLVLWAAHYADSITLVSDSELTEVKNNIPNNPVFKKMEVIHNGVIDHHEKILSKSMNDNRQLGSHKPTILLASRLVTDKGITESIRAFEIVQKKYPKSLLLLLGDGPERKRFEDMAKDNSSIIFKGLVDNPLEYMAQSDVFIHPTYHEGFSVALVEASMMGLPIVATGVGGNLEIIRHNNTGILVPVKDETTLAKEILRLLDDPQLRISLGVAARKQFLKDYEFSEIVKKRFIPLYTGAMQ